MNGDITISILDQAKPNDRFVEVWQGPRVPNVGHIVRTGPTHQSEWEVRVVSWDSPRSVVLKCSRYPFRR